MHEGDFSSVEYKHRLVFFDSLGRVTAVPSSGKGMTCLLKDGVAKGVVSANSFVLGGADDGVIAVGIHLLAAGWTDRVYGGVDW